MQSGVGARRPLGPAGGRAQILSLLSDSTAARHYRRHHRRAPLPPPYATSARGLVTGRASKVLQMRRPVRRARAGGEVRHLPLELRRQAGEAVREVVIEERR